MADCSTTAADTDSELSVRIGAAFGIFLVSSVGVMLPKLAMAAKLENVFFVLRAAGAGVVLATGVGMRYWPVQGFIVGCKSPEHCMHD